jgi:hypothetical protein
VGPLLAASISPAFPLLAIANRFLFDDECGMLERVFPSGVRPVI